MNEEQAVLDFFAQQENLPLGLSVAEQMDSIREQMNNRFWKALRQRLDALIAEHDLHWQTALTEDKNARDTVVGLYCIPRTPQMVHLRPMMEQQLLGGAWRIYYGLMWNTVPAAEQLQLPAVRNLKASLQHEGYKDNENFLAWQWTMLYPRRRDFLLRYANQPAGLLEEVEAIFKSLLIDHGDAIAQANESPDKISTGSLSSTLDQLRGELLG